MQIDIYTTRHCPYCNSAKALLKRKGVTFNEIDIAANVERLNEMLARAEGAATLPQIFIGSLHVGGSDHLHALDREGKLDALLAERV